jgi:hypothetical protein
MKSSQKPQPKQTPGPKPERLKINIPWKNAVKASLQKEKPPSGRPIQGKER